MNRPISDAGVTSDCAISIKVFRTLEEIEGLRWFWSSCSGSRDSDIDVITTAQRINKDILRPHVLGLYRAGILDALLIGRIIHQELPFNIGYVHLLSSQVAIIDFPYGALRGNDSEENCEALIHEVMRSLNRGEADIALLEHIGLGSALFHSGRRAAAFFLRDRFSPIRPHWKRELPASLESFKESLSSSQRTRFRQIAKKLSKDFAGQANIIKHSGVESFDRAMQDVAEVAKDSWQSKMGLGGFNTSAALRAKLQAEAAMGVLLVYVLYLSGKPTAFWIGSAYQNTFYSDFMAYDPNYASYSVGTHLLAEVLGDLCLQGVHTVDFGFSDEEYKRRFGNGVWDETNLHLFPPTPKGLRLCFLRGSTALISNSLRALLQSTGLMQKVKKSYRKAGNDSDQGGASDASDHETGKQRSDRPPKSE